MSNQHAIVIGGSMAGLCAARVLSEFFDRVTVVDRDAYPVGAHERPGVPQSRHVHALLTRGRLELENLFPGFERTMLARGALDINFGLDFAAFRETGWSPRRRTTLSTLFASRVLIESTVRELLRKLDNVELIERADAIGFEVERGNVLRATGIKVGPRDGGANFVLSGDLIIDASGRATKIPSWFASLGLPAPEETVVDAHVGYASRWYRKIPERRPSDWWWKGVWIDPVFEQASSAGVLFPVEGERFIVTIAGFAGNYPPNDEEAFNARLRELRSPVISEEVACAEPISPVYSYRQMANRWRHYDRWQGRLDGFIALGDSTCAFNPAYGQGMTSGALSALILRECLLENGVAGLDMPRNFFARLARFQSEPWGMATGADFRVPGVEGYRPLASRITAPIFSRLFEVQTDDEMVADTLGEVINMLKPPAALFSAAMLARIARAWIRRIAGGHRTVPDTSPRPPLGAPTVLAA